VILNGIFGALAVLSFLLTLWQWLAARRFPLHRRIEPTPDPSTRGEKRSARVRPVPLLGGVRGGFVPAVTLLKPLKGCDEHTEACLRSWLAQDYAGEIQFLFGIADAGDPAASVVKKLLAEFPRLDARLIVCPERLGANAKVSKLAQLEPHVKHDILLVSDADVLVPPDLLTNAIALFTPSLSLNRFASSLSPRDEGAGREPERGAVRKKSPPLPDPLLHSVEERENAPRSFGSGVQAATSDSGGLSPSDGERVAEGRVRGAAHRVGLVNCFYCLANPTTLAMRWEAIAINADFWSQVLQSQSLKPLDFALGAVMVTRRKLLAEIGGFRALADCLADDYQLGHYIVQRGHRIELCPVVAECWSPPMNWRQVWRHQLRWARTIRVCQPLPYFFSILSNATLWPLLWLLVTQPHFFVVTRSASGNTVTDVDVSLSLVVALIFLMTRVVTASLLYQQLTRKGIGLAAPVLVLMKDLLQVALWVGAFLGRHIEWHGERYRLRGDGTLERRSIVESLNR